MGYWRTLDFMQPIMLVPALGIIWDITPAELQVSPLGVSLKLFWSSGLAPLDRLVIYDSGETLWRVRVDAVTGGRLTAVVGEVESPPDSAMVFVETIARYEVPNPAAVCAIPIEVV